MERDEYWIREFEEYLDELRRYAMERRVDPRGVGPRELEALEALRRARDLLRDALNQAPGYGDTDADQAPGYGDTPADGYGDTDADRYGDAD